MTVKRLTAHLLVLSLLFLDGCLFLPLGHRATPKEIYETDLAFVKVGVTTRSEVVERLGDPLSVSEKQNTIYYNWYTETDFFWGLLSPEGGGAGTFTYRQDYLLEIEFHSDDKVKKFQRIQLPHRPGSSNTWFSYH